jgi:3-hydroxyisobutyrate dehydrogenase
MKAGFIGLGCMGLPMARNLAKVGLLDCVWNRTETRRLEVSAELDVFAAATPRELAARVDVVLICVSADADLLEVVNRLVPGLKPGSVVVDHSTVATTTARIAAERVAARDCEFLDIPVSGGVEGARNGKLAMMAGGAAQALERVMPVLQAMGSRIVHMGPVGSGQATKAVNQILCAGINQAVTEALGFGAAQGLDLDKVIEVVAGGAAGNWFLDRRGPTMIHDRFDPGFKLALHHKDLAICLDMARELGYALPVTEMTLQDYERLMQLGHGDEDISALYRLKRPSNATKPAHQPTPYERIGGEAAIRALAERFYHHMNELPEVREIRKMHAADLGGAKDKLYKFLTGWLGGPDLFVQEFGPVRLRMRHFPFAIGIKERDQWVLCMRKAMDDTPMDAELKEKIFEALAQTATHMINAET